jgi:DNA helicase HerA-like ATPase
MEGGGGMSTAPKITELLSDDTKGLVQELRKRIEERLTVTNRQVSFDTATSQRIGRVVSLTGAQAVTLLEIDEVDAQGVLSRSLQMGSVVKIPTARSVVFGMISGLTIPMPALENGQPEGKLLELELLGESLVDENGNLSPMRRGVSTYPALGSDVHAAGPLDLRFVYVRDQPSVARIGNIHQDRNLPAQINVDDLLGKHFAVVGATGTGKSCAVTLILRAVLKRNPNGHILLLDPHNEYHRAFGEMANVIDLQTLRLPFWVFNFAEMREVLANAGARLAPAESALLNDLITQAKRQFLGSAAEGRYITSDTPTPYRMTQIVTYIDDILGRLERPESIAPYEALKTAIATLQNDVRFAFMFDKGIATRDTLASIVSTVFRVPVQGRPLTILDLSAVPSDILNVVVSVLCRVTFEFAMWSEGKVPILLVCEEAHLYAPENAEAGFEPTKRALARIAKEGRKYGISLGIATQRPAELASSMLSQCNTIFAMRLSHERDQQWVRAALSDGAIGLLDALPSLGTAEAIAVGEGIAMPMRLMFDQLPDDQRPRSASAQFSASWKEDMADGEEFVYEVIDRWRRQRREGG